jgi:hypothetical protein
MVLRFGRVDGGSLGWKRNPSPWTGGIRDDFNGIAVVNRGSDFTLHRITLIGAK